MFSLNIITRSMVLVAAFSIGVVPYATDSFAIAGKSQLSGNDANAIAMKIMNWWSGDYDNDAQIDALRADGAPIWIEGQAEKGQNMGGHLPMRSHYRPVDLPLFGERVLYVEEFSFGDKPYRQRIYTINVDEITNEVRVKLWYFSDEGKKKYANAYIDTTRLSDLKPEEMSPLPDNCDMIVKRADDGKLHMVMPDCTFGKKVFDYQVKLSKDEFWFRDRIADAETKIVTMTAGSFTYHKLKRSK
ncbi:chromophore lyase CpcT/CpeT [Sphingorhabdus sp. EL138]|uniref:chromophore lyase CpcT/CpeT n=1 Tax=Sphingorhabdus sp. EL138 TaxID=2073156 RepID=UPI000D6854A7|nr:chromophore lyase CpcT/CpeT [Sphingorhabdus sp. EL138]